MPAINESDVTNTVFCPSRSSVNLNVHDKDKTQYIYVPITCNDYTSLNMITIVLN